MTDAQRDEMLIGIAAGVALSATVTTDIFNMLAPGRRSDEMIARVNKSTSDLLAHLEAQHRQMAAQASSFAGLRSTN